jgi:hypothetical protein
LNFARYVDVETAMKKPIIQILPSGRNVNCANDKCGAYEIANDAEFLCCRRCLLSRINPRKIYYCRLQCQREHWSLHKKTCGRGRAVDWEWHPPKMCLRMEELD